MRTDRILIALLLLIGAAGCATKYQADRDIGVAHQEIRRAEEDWAKAIRDRDSLSLERHLAPGFFVQSIAPDRPATSVDRAQWLANTMKLRLDSVSIRDVQVRLRGPRGDTAVAELWFWWKPGRVPSDNRLEDTWVKQGTKWQAVRRVILESRITQ